VVVVPRAIEAVVRPRARAAGIAPCRVIGLKRRVIRRRRGGSIGAMGPERHGQGGGVHAH
jgi:hypothetical protein